MAENNFPKTYDHKSREAFWQKFWEREQIYKFDEKSKKPIYSVDTPPPYVSAEHLHLGHIMSYSQAEFVVRFKRMQGFSVFYPMGFDDNGLPTERYVEKKYNLDKSKIERAEFIKKCLLETKLGAQNYKKLWTSLGISCDWSKTYSTINPHCQKISQWSFLDLYKKGKLVRREEPIHWCPKCQTALAQADLEDKEEEGLISEIEFQIEGKPYFVATTRPELLAACVALFFHPKDSRYQHLKNKKAIVPIFNYEVPILSDLSVDKDFGTGLMMVCTWGDIEDIKKWKKYDLLHRPAITSKGTLSSLAKKYQGQNIQKARENILSDFKKIGKLKKQEKITHTLNIHERCGTPAEFVLTRQWFISLLENKEKFLARGRKLRWFPDHMRSRYNDWVKTLAWDWCISRQRYYGVPFPVWYCKKCQKAILPKEEEDLPVDPREEEPKIKKCPKCGSKEFVGEKDAMDTWMTSSMTPLIGARLVKNDKMQKKLYPATLRPQAFEIIRTWLFYTVVKSLYHHNSLPFFDVMISGHGLDEKGRKISKRLKNYIEPQKILSECGADAIRYWATGATLGENMRFSPEEIKKGKRLVVKIWNASRFCFLHLRNFTPAKNFTPKDFCDRWILDGLQKTIGAATKFFENYEYSKARRIIEDFFWHDFCDRYLEFVKYRLYTDSSRAVILKPRFIGAEESPGFQASQNLDSAKNTLYLVLLTILKLYAPILPFITEEIYQLYFKKIEKVKSIHLTLWPKVDKGFFWPEKEKVEFSKVLAAADAIRKCKTEKGISLGKEIESFKVSDKKIKEKFGKFLQKSLRVKRII
ncbi:MAG: valine--tRNA ligase [Patescibacteria group bacterium]